MLEERELNSIVTAISRTNPFYFNVDKSDSYKTVLGCGDDSGELGSESLGLLSLELGSNSVQISAALAGQSASTIGVLLCQLQSLQSLQSLPGNTAVTASPVARGGTVVGTDSVDLADGGNSNRGPDQKILS